MPFSITDFDPKFYIVLEKNFIQLIYRGGGIIMFDLVIRYKLIFILINYSSLRLKFISHPTLIIKPYKKLYNNMGLSLIKKQVQVNLEAEMNSAVSQTKEFTNLILQSAQVFTLY